MDLRSESNLDNRLENVLLHHNAIRKGLNKKVFEKDKLKKELLKIAPEILKFAQPVWLKIDQFHQDRKKILFEGAQGIGLDVDHGIYPYTTSSNTAAGHISTGTGVSFRDIGRIIGVVKAYLSRVGESPLPSEIHGNEAEALREKGGEYGTTTGRPRRVGWLDLVQVRQAVRVNGLTEIALTKLDVLSGFESIKVCVSYNVNGGNLLEMPASLSQYRLAKPVYESLPGWDNLPDKIWEEGFNALSETLKDYIKFVEDQIDCPVKLISVGPQRHETILR